LGRFPSLPFQQAGLTAHFKAFCRVVAQEPGLSANVIACGVAQARCIEGHVLDKMKCAAFAVK
jgi:hypothetical protein